jgi:CMP-N-acetylneuraminic acid synthetase
MAKVLGIIPARGGSKGIPNKHTRKLAGKSILARAAKTAFESGVIDRLILSSNDAEIIGEAKKHNIETPFVRPAELAQDETAMLPVLQHAVEAFEDGSWQPEIIVLLQATAPIRKAEHIRMAVKKLIESKADSVVSVIEIPHLFAPQKALKKGSEGLEFWVSGGGEITRRQQLEKSYAREGTVYAFWRATLMEADSIYGENCQPLVLDGEESLTLDSESDWNAAVNILATQKKEHE